MAQIYNSHRAKTISLILNRFGINYILSHSFIRSLILIFVSLLLARFHSFLLSRPLSISEDTSNTQLYFSDKNTAVLHKKTVLRIEAARIYVAQQIMIRHRGKLLRQHTVFLLSNRCTVCTVSRVCYRWVYILSVGCYG